MVRPGIILLAVLLSPAALIAQHNPFALTGGSVKSANIVYEMTGEPQPNNPMPQFTVAEVGVTSERWIMRTTAPVEIAGKKDTMKTLIVASRDSQYIYLEMRGTKDGKVSLILRPHLAREYAALDAAGKSRFKENMKLLSRSSMSGSSGDAGREYVTLLGEKKGSETIAGHKCDVYQYEKTTVCIMSQAPGVVLRSSDDGVTTVAKKVTLNGPVPTAASVLPKGVRWKKEGYAYEEEFAVGLWEHKKESDPDKVPPATMAKFVVGYLASPAAAAELKEMDPGMGGVPDESGAVDDAGEDDSAN